MADQKRGLLFSFEGVDRSGKTTQSKKLQEQLQKDGLKVELIRFPDRTTRTGKVIDRYLKGAKGEDDLDDRAIHLLFSANRWESAQRIRSLLESGTHVILDRYAHSGVAYTMAKGGISLVWSCAPDVGLPEPDRIFYLNVPVDVAEKRGGFGGERYEQIAFQRRVAEAYKTVMNISENVSKMDVGKCTIDEVHKVVIDCARIEIKYNRNDDIGKLWCKH